MKVIFDATPLLANRTGIAYYIEQMVVEMAKAHPETEFVGFYYNFLGKRSTQSLVRLKNLSYTNASILPSKIVYQLRRWGIEFPIELISLQWNADFIVYGNFLGYPSLRKTPSTMVIHDLTYIDLPQYVSAKLRRDLERFVPKQIKRSNFIVTVSEFSKQRIKDILKPSQDIIVTPIPPARPTLHNDTDCQAALHKLGIYKPYILTLGTVEPRKNIAKLIEAYKDLPEDVREKYALVIAGRIGWYSEADEAAIKAATHEGYDVHHLGYVQENEREILYQAATLFVCASHYEGFGMPILEAMSYGTPCAVSDISVFHEVAGNAADYFDQEKAGVIAAHLESLLTNKQLLEKLGTEAKQRAESFDWRAIAESLYERIERTMSEQK